MQKAGSDPKYDLKYGLAMEKQQRSVRADDELHSLGNFDASSALEMLLR